MSPAAKEIEKAVPYTFRREEQLLCAVVSGKMTAHHASRALTPGYMNHVDSGVLKIEQAALEDFEFYRDLVKEKKHHDKELLLSTAENLRKLWDRL